MTDPTPKLAPGVRLHGNGTKLLGPERILELDDIAQAIVRELDGKKRVSEIAAILAKEYNEREGVIRKDIDALVADLAAKGYIKL
jgi:pyrroloquinoline quinone biosynthesis protein D